LLAGRFGVSHVPTDLKPDHDHGRRMQNQHDQPQYTTYQLKYLETCGLEPPSWALGPSSHPGCVICTAASFQTAGTQHPQALQVSFSACWYCEQLILIITHAAPGS
jgi:hypothetical protein